VTGVRAGLLPQSGVFPRLTLASRRVTTKLAWLPAGPGEAVWMGGVMCAQRGSPVAADETGGAALSSPPWPGAAGYERVGRPP
jgi:hypothetical protein